MFSLMVLTNKETAPGFRLAGVQVVEAQTPDEARHQLVDLLNDQRSGIIAVDEALAEGIDAPLQAKIDQLYRPVVVVLPSTTAGVAQESKRLYFEKLIKKAVGFEMKLE